mgnify:CR=1 FL=1
MIKIQKLLLLNLYDLYTGREIIATSNKIIRILINKRSSSRNFKFLIVSTSNSFKKRKVLKFTDCTFCLYRMCNISGTIAMGRSQRKYGAKKLNLITP